MKFDLTSPCIACPFRSDIEFALARGRVYEIYDGLTLRDATFSCHKTVTHDDDGEYVPKQDEQHCAGAMIMLMRMDMPNQMMRIAERIGAFDPDKLNMKAAVFDTVDDMADARENAYKGDRNGSNQGEGVRGARCGVRRSRRA